MSGVTAPPATSAECRDETRAASEPSLIHEVRLSGSPLSNTEESGPDACAITNGAQGSPGGRGARASPGVRGSLDSVTGCADRRSPIRVPPPGLLNTVRPSAASFAPADKYR